MAASRAPEFVNPSGAAQARVRTKLTADTSAQPDGLTRRVLLNILEAFFRRPVLHLLPLLLMLAIGVASVINAKSEYISVGTMSVTNESLLADLTDATRTAGVTFDSVAEVTAQQINELLRTDQFMGDIAKRAGLDSLVTQGVLDLKDLRAATGATADGENIVRVGATTEDPELSFRLADSTIKSYRDWVVAGDVSQSTTTQTSLEKRVAEKQTAATAADAAVTAKFEEAPDVPVDERSPADQQEIARLQDAADRAQSQLEQAQDALDTAKLQTDQASAVVSQRLKVLDNPEVPTAPTGGLKTAIFSMAIFFFLGLLLSLASVVISATLDRTIRVPNDITARFGVDVLAVVPNVAR